MGVTSTCVQKTLKGKSSFGIIMFNRKSPTRRTLKQKNEASTQGSSSRKTRSSSGPTCSRTSTPDFDEENETFADHVYGYTKRKTKVKKPPRRHTVDNNVYQQNVGQRNLKVGFASMIEASSIEIRDPKYQDVSKWHTSEIRDTINFSNDIDLIQACHSEMEKRVRLYKRQIPKAPILKGEIITVENDITPGHSPISEQLPDIPKEIFSSEAKTDDSDDDDNDEDIYTFKPLPGIPETDQGLPFQEIPNITITEEKANFKGDLINFDSFDAEDLVSPVVSYANRPLPEIPSDQEALIDDDEEDSDYEEIPPEAPPRKQSLEKKRVNKRHTLPRSLQITPTFEASSNIETGTKVKGKLTSGTKLMIIVEMICLPDHIGMGFIMQGGRVLILPRTSTNA